MKITIESDDLTLADVKALGRWVRRRFKGASSHGNMWVEAPEVTAVDALAILREIFGKEAPEWDRAFPHAVKMFRWGGGSNGK